jgi:hypothetical protein
MSYISDDVLFTELQQKKIVAVTEAVYKRNMDKLILQLEELTNKNRMENNKQNCKINELSDEIDKLKRKEYSDDRIDSMISNIKKYALREDLERVRIGFSKLSEEVRSLNKTTLILSNEIREINNKLKFDLLIDNNQKKDIERLQLEVISLNNQLNTLKNTYLVSR